MNTEQAIIAAEPLPYVCPAHPAIELTHRLAGGAGHCRACNFFQQSANHPMPTLPPKPEMVKTKAKRAAQPNEKAGKRRSRKTRARKQAPTVAVRPVGVGTGRTERKQ